MKELVKGTVADLKKELTRQLYKGKHTPSAHIHFRGDQFDYADLLSEAGDVEMKRRVCKQELEALHKASQVIASSDSL